MVSVHRGFSAETRWLLALPNDIIIVEAKLILLATRPVPGPRRVLGPHPLRQLALFAFAPAPAPTASPRHAPFGRPARRTHHARRPGLLHSARTPGSARDAPPRGRLRALLAALQGLRGADGSFSRRLHITELSSSQGGVLQPNDNSKHRVKPYKDEPGIQILAQGKGKGVQARRALPGTWASCIPLTSSHAYNSSRSDAGNPQGHRRCRHAFLFSWLGPLSCCRSWP